MVVRFADTRHALGFADDGASYWAALEPFDGFAQESTSPVDDADLDLLSILERNEVTLREPFDQYQETRREYAGESLEFELQDYGDNTLIDDAVRFQILADRARRLQQFVGRQLDIVDRLSPRLGSCGDRMDRLRRSFAAGNEACSWCASFFRSLSDALTQEYVRRFPDAAQSPLEPIDMGATDSTNLPSPW